jgi:hypothetical protein
MNRSTPTILVIGAALAATLSGCASAPSITIPSGTEPTPAANASINGLKPACTILTKALAKSVLGASVKRTMDAQPNPKETHCQYQSHTSAVDLLVGPYSYVQDIDPSAKKVTGFGDAATASSSQFTVRKGSNGIDLMVSIAGSFSGGAADRVEAKQLKLEEKLAPSLVSQLP